MPLDKSKVKNFLQSNVFPIILVIVCITIALLNFSPRTWQTGWDTLHPEFNWGINIPRHFFGIWQENQGLGSVGGHSHAADISRIIVMFILSFVFPTHVLRYIPLFLTLILGPLGTYFFAYYVLFRKEPKESLRKFLSFTAGLFYLFNLGTVQQYIVQLEMYTFLYGFLPWFFLFAGRYILEKSRKMLLYLAIVCIFGAPLAYAITVFLSLYVCLFSYAAITSLVLYLKEKDGSIFKRFIFVNLVVILMNSYWLFPSLYFGLKHSSFVSVSNINAQFSDRIFSYNVKHGNVLDLLRINGFLTDWQDYNFTTARQYPLMGNWMYRLNANIFVQIAEALIFLILIVGFVKFLIVKDENKIGILITLFICVFMFMTLNFPFGGVFAFAKERLSMFSELFRNPYTKFSVQLIFVYSIFFSFGVLTVVDLLRKFGKLNSRTVAYVGVGISLLLGFYMLPAFKGNLVSKDVRISIPMEYFDAFNWLNSQKDTRRIANLPIHSFWGWEYYNWGYQGAGFLWFGTKQPVLARDFDRWNPFNEEYYYEMSHAVYARDLPKLEEVVRKYGIGYVLLDENNVNIGGNSENTFIVPIKEMLSKSKLLYDQADFGGIHIYKVNDGQTQDIYSLKKGSHFTVEYPFQEGRKFVDGLGKEITSTPGASLIKGTYSLPKGSYQLVLPSISDLEKLITVDLYAKREGGNVLVKFVYLVPQIFLQNASVNPNEISQEFTLSEPSKSGFLSLNDSYYYDLNSVTVEYTKLGSALLNTASDSSLTLYKESPILSKDVLATPMALYSCSSGEDADLTFFPNYISILSGVSVGCGEYDLVLPSGTFLFKTDLSYLSELGTKPSYCIYDKSEDSCVSSNIKYDTPVLKETYSALTDFVTAKVGGDAGIKLFAPLDAELGVSRVSYNKIKVGVYASVSSLQIPVDTIKTALVSSSLVFNFDTTSQTPVVFGSIISNSSVNYTHNGENLYSVSVLENPDTKAQHKEFVNGIKLSTLDASLYDSVNFRGIRNDVSYLLNVSNDNLGGNSLVVSVQDYLADSNIIDKKLSSETSVFEVPNQLYSQETDGLRIGFTNVSIGNKPSVNVVKSVSLVPYPGNWLSHIKVVAKGEPDLDVTALAVRKYSPSAYKVTNVTVGDELIFNQSYDPAWIAIGASEHTIINGWANGWRVDGTTVWLIFIPGVVQFFLYFVTLGTFIGVFFAYRMGKMKQAISQRND